MNRRGFLTSTSGILIAAAIPSIAQATQQSPLIYLSPIKSDGTLSRCQAEVWYVQDGVDMYVVTGTGAWRSVAVKQGLTSAQVWVGDVGMWQQSNGSYKGLPSMMTQVSFETNGVNHTRLLEKFGAKYSAEWGTWGPRFKNGLADGSRVMLKYSPV